MNTNINAYIFPATGPSFIGQSHDQYMPPPDEKCWLIGGSAGAYRALNIFYDLPAESMIDGMCDITWYPWRFQSSLTAMMLQLQGHCIDSTNLKKIDTPSNHIPVIMVTRTYYSPWIILVICVICSFLGIYDMIYRLAELQIYVPQWADVSKFPLEFDDIMKYRFVPLTSSNVSDVLYDSSRLPFLSLSRSNNNLCDAGILFYHHNGRVRDGFKTMLLGSGKTNQMCRTFTDFRPIDTTNLQKNIAMTIKKYLFTPLMINT